ncbi:MAG TPA: PEP-CTERM sorting domain-containing protein [Pyrinomonadaceae bacterium]|jgi:hypothetical protein|nr:PEP-CTERM sorting domain-containing protein [Pyrinomonadaceae bacterium]
MKTHLTMLAKSLTLMIVALAVFSLSGGAARADELTLTGFSAGGITGVPQLSFAGNLHFTGTTALGVGALSGPNSLGTFFLSTDQLQPVAGTFFLNIFFTSPTGIIGAPSVTIPAIITGTVSPNVDQGGVNIDFGNQTLFFDFNDGINTGSFSLTVANVFVQSGQAANLTAGFTGQQSAIPEPATLLLLGTGLTAVGARLRKRRRERA